MRIPKLKGKIKVTANLQSIYETLRLKTRMALLIRIFF